MISLKHFYSSMPMSQQLLKVIFMQIFLKFSDLTLVI